MPPKTIVSRPATSFHFHSCCSRRLFMALLISSKVRPLCPDHLLSLQVDGYRCRRWFFVVPLILQRLLRSVDVVGDNLGDCFVSPLTPSRGSPQRLPLCEPRSRDSRRTVIVVRRTSSRGAPVL